MYILFFQNKFKYNFVQSEKFYKLCLVIYFTYCFTSLKSYIQGIFLATVILIF